MFYVSILGMRNANTETWETLLDVYKAENDASEKLKLINGLAYVNNETLLNRYYSDIFFISRITKVLFTD